MPGGHGSLPPARAGRFLTVLAFLLLLSPAAAAGSVRFAIGSGPEPYFMVALEGQPAAGGQAGLGLSGPAPLRLDVNVRRTTGLGILGNIILDVDGSISTDGTASAAVTGRAAAGPLAFRAHGEASASVAPASAAGALTRWNAGAGVTWRVERNLLLLADPAVRGGAGGGPVVTVPVEVQLPRFVGGHDLRFRVEGSFGRQGSPGSYAAAGAGLRIDRGRAPAWEAWLLFGGSPAGMSPGLSLRLREDSGRHTAEAVLLLEPWRTGETQLDLQLGWTVRGEKHDVELNAWLLAPAGSVGAEVAVRLPFPGG